MPKKFFKQYSPRAETLKQYRSLRWLGKSIEDPNIWHMNRQSVARAFLIGLIVAFLPIPLQMFVAAACALWFHANLPIAASLVWITNPLTFAPMFYAAYKVGAWLLQTPEQVLSFQPSLEIFTSQLEHIWQPLLLGCLVCGVLSGLIAHAFIWRLWRWQVISRWEERKRLRVARQVKTS
ncbi:MAG: DUF2062 domain-containing protein [Pseudomonadales bacterium]